VDEKFAATEGIDQEPCECHQEEVGGVVAECNVLGSASIEAEKLQFD
jgi:hypothetical protein